MVLAMCTKNIFTVDLDFESGRWSNSEVYDTINLLKRYTKFMHDKGIDLLFKIFRTDKGLHAILVNKRVESYSDDAIKMSVALCNDPFYTAFSKLFGYCLRVGPKVYRDLLSSKSLYTRITSEIVSKEYSDPKYIGYGKEDRTIGKIMDLKNSLIRFVKAEYKKNFERMTRLRYIPFVDDFKMCPPDDFFERLIQLAKELYISNINKNFVESEYKYNYVHKKLSHSSLSNAYDQKNLSLYFDLHEYIWGVKFKDVIAVTYSELNLDSFNDIMEGLRQYSIRDNEYYVVISEEDRSKLVVLFTYDKDNLDEKLIHKFKDLNDNMIYDIAYYVRISPLINVENEEVKVDYTESQIVSKIKNQEILTIGESQYFSKLLELMIFINDYLFSLYRDNTEEMTMKRKIREKRTPTYSPSINTIDKIRSVFVDKIQELDLKRVENIVDEGKFVRSNRYLDILSIEDIRSCYKSIYEVKKQMKIVKQYVLKDAGFNFLYSHGDYPFVFGQSVHANMIFISTYDVLMLDWDVKLGITKQTAILILRRFIESQMSIPISKRIFKSEPCFKIYETDNGTHAYLISQFLPHNEELVSKLMIEVCSDINYAAMVKFKGYSIRLSPKIYVDKEYTGPDYIKTQFIQNEGLQVGREMVYYVGNENNINPHIEEFVDIIYRTQKFIMEHDADYIYDTMYKRIEENIAKWGEFLVNSYENMRNKRVKDSEYKRGVKWSEDVDDISRIEAIN